MTIAPPAYRVDGALVDGSRFVAHACDPSRGVVIEACAGAGKTWLLVSRIIRALLAGAAPQNILAITYTRKAAGEVRARLAEWLAHWASPGCSDDERIGALIERGLPETAARQQSAALAALHPQLLAAGREVEIHTFHGWFAQLLRAAPLELLDNLGLQPDMAITIELDDHIAEVRRRFHRRVLADPALRDDHDTLVRDRGRSKARDWVELSLDKRVEIELAAAAGRLDASVPPAAEVWTEFAAHGDTPQARLREKDAVRLLGGVANALEAKGAKAARARTQGAALRTALDEADDLTAARLAHDALHTDTRSPRKLGDIPGLDDACTLLARIDAACHQQAAHLEHARVSRLALALLAAYRGYKRERGLVDMADLEQGALALLNDAALAGWTQQRLDARVRHLLIDEFQDTSPLQWHALHGWLSGYAGAGGGVSGQAPPSVFIVGDPKQSIYRFRRAEPRVFAAARNFAVEAFGAHVLTCDHTRRNAPAVIAAVNAVFAPMDTAAPWADGFRPHTTERADGGVPGSVGSLPPVRRPPDDGRSGTRTCLATTDSDRADDAPGEQPSHPAAILWRDTLTAPRLQPEVVRAYEEARRVAADIARLVATEGVQPGEVMVLARRRVTLRLAADALAEQGLPFTAADTLPLRDSPEARDVVAVLDALASPTQALALAQTLRCPLFGASDDDLIALADSVRRDGVGWWQALTAPVAAQSLSPTLQRAGLLLAQWSAAARHLPPHDLLDRIVAEGDWRIRLAAAVVPERRASALAALDAVIDAVLRLDGGRHASLYASVRALKSRAIALPPVAQPGSVQLLTVHGAKGLESRTVYLMDADPEPKPADTATVLIDWPVEAAAPRCCAFVYSEAEARCPASLSALLEDEMAARRREERNGLYVAMTRARDRLVVSATEPSRRAGPSWWALLLPHLPEVPLPDVAAGRPGADNGAGAVQARAAIGVEAGRDAVGVEPGRDAVGVELDRDAVGVVDLPTWQPSSTTLAGQSSTGDRSRTGAEAEDATPATARLGRAVHRVLQWAVPTTLRPQPACVALPALAAAAAREFRADPDAVAAVAGAVLSSAQTRRFVDPAHWRWAANEHVVVDGDDVLRLDRLVALSAADGGDEWWVLDYKLAPDPASVPAHIAQLRRYRAVVARLHAGRAVHAAFITGEGQVQALPLPLPLPGEP